VYFLFDGRGGKKHVVQRMTADSRTHYTGKQTALLPLRFIFCFEVVFPGGGDFFFPPDVFLDSSEVSCFGRFFATTAADVTAIFHNLPCQSRDYDGDKKWRLTTHLLCSSAKKRYLSQYLEQ